jgi:predicted RNA-binding protein with PUA-like domain
MSDRRYWLVKSEPEEFSFGDLLRSPKHTTGWDGVRSYAARVHLRAMKIGDLVLFYHSNANPAAIVGVAEVAREAYPDHTAFDPRGPHHDPKSTPNDPTWFMVDLKAVESLDRPVSLDELKAQKELEQMALLRIGRLSVQPVTEDEYAIIRGLAATTAKRKVARGKRKKG